MELLKNIGKYVTAIAVAILGFLFITKRKAKAEPNEIDPRVAELEKEKEKEISSAKEKREEADSSLTKAKDVLAEGREDISEIDENANRDIELKTDDWNS